MSPPCVGTTDCVRTCLLVPSAAYAVGGGMPPPYKDVLYSESCFISPRSACFMGLESGILELGLPSQSAS